VTSGPSPESDELYAIRRTIGLQDRPSWCASLGILSYDQLASLRDAGLTRYHHNIETCRSYFGEICSTHSWDQRARTVADARRAGLQVCSGGIIGMGESNVQRVEMAVQLRDLGVDSVALNFLIPIPGTCIGACECDNVEPEDLLRTIILFRMMLPEAEIRICGGRKRLKGYTGRIFKAGVTGIMTGRLLTTEGSDRWSDVALVYDAGMNLG
jgi:biotin synthase